MNRLIANWSVVALLAATYFAGAADNVIYEQGFEGDVEPTRMHTNSKDYTVHFKGVTEEKAANGSRSYKIDIASMR